MYVCFAPPPCSAKKLFIDKVSDHVKEGKPLSLDEENAEISATVEAQFEKSKLK